MRVVLNKDAFNARQYVRTAAHEFIHATFRNTLKGDPNAKKNNGSTIT